MWFYLQECSLVENGVSCKEGGASLVTRLKKHMFMLFTSCIQVEYSLYILLFPGKYFIERNLYVLTL